tara:strand:+ start:608 stop:781 length:174 start_codon:yes stop_codon:yes gene_type:complete
MRTGVEHILLTLWRAGAVYKLVERKRVAKMPPAPIFKLLFQLYMVNEIEVAELYSMK